MAKINYFNDQEDQTMVINFLKRFNPKIQGHISTLLSDTIPGFIDIMIGDGGDDDIAEYDHNLIVWEFLKIMTPEQCQSIENLDEDDLEGFSEQVMKLYIELKETVFPEVKWEEALNNLRSTMAPDLDGYDNHQLYQQEKLYLENHGMTSLEYGYVCRSKE